MKKELDTKKQSIATTTCKKPYTVSCSNIQLFLECPCCFYYDKRFGIKRPPGYPFNINRAVDILLRKEFDLYRASKTAHPLMKKYGIDVIPFEYPLMNDWRDFSKGIQHLHKSTNILVTDVIDDIWIDKKNRLVAVDYRATSQEDDIDLSSDFGLGYMRLIDVHQWLLRQFGFKVSNTGYFLYCNGMTDRKSLNGKLDFDMKLIPYEGDDDWVDIAITEIGECLKKDYPPEMSEDCEYCDFIKERASKMVVFI